MTLMHKSLIDSTFNTTLTTPDRRDNNIEDIGRKLLEATKPVKIYNLNSKLGVKKKSQSCSN
jgi:hypothetical protein